MKFRITFYFSQKSLESTTNENSRRQKNFEHEANSEDGCDFFLILKEDQLWKTATCLSRKEALIKSTLILSRTTANEKSLWQANFSKQLLPNFL